MKKIAVMDTLKLSVVERLKEIGEVNTLPDEKFLENAEIMIVRSRTKVNKELLDKCKNLKIVIRAGVGIDNIDVKECEKRGVKVRNTPSASTRSVAEITIGAMISVMRKIGYAHENMKKGKWVKKQCRGNEIQGKTLGIIGYGRIGRLVGSMASALGMKVIATDPRSNDECIVSFDQLLEKSDVISLHARLTPETRGMINKQTIEKMKQGVYIINFARGEMINEDDVYSALKDGKIAGLAMDVYAQEPYTGKLLELENVLLTPHIGANTNEAQERIGQEIIKIIEEL